MLLLYKNIKNSPSVPISMTGLTGAGFGKLLPLFGEAWNDYVTEKYIKNKERKRGYGGGRRPELRNTGDRLFFIFFYLKTYPVQQVPALLFGMSRSRADVRVRRLAEVLRRAIGKGACLPERNPGKSEDALKKCPRLCFVTGGAEREIQRPGDPERQKFFFSGRKKTHTLKNNFTADAGSRKAVYPSGTYEGKKHDKKIWDEENPNFPGGGTVFRDTGFQGREPENAIACQPEKKPRGKKLPAGDRISNTMTAGVRITAEHAAAGIKRLRILRDVFRNTREGSGDPVMETACALHNLRVTSRSPKHTKKGSEPVYH